MPVSEMVDCAQPKPATTHRFRFNSSPEFLQCIYIAFVMMPLRNRFPTPTNFHLFVHRATALFVFVGPVIVFALVAPKAPDLTAALADAKIAAAPSARQAPQATACIREVADARYRFFHDRVPPPSSSL